ncbi:MAG TPA: hypothetical protein VHC22_32450 [Pirellulales bacterium]|nr:hypothetical protein [Pirellulales bacterium]
MPEVRLSGTLCLAHNPEYSPGQGQATSYFNPIGPEPGVGYVWMLSSDAQELDFDEPQVLSFTVDDESVSFSLYIDSAIAASGISRTDVDRAYLLTLRDVRFILDRQTDCNIACNCRVPAAPTDSIVGEDVDEFYVDTLNPLDAEPYAWSDVVEVLWGLCPNSLVGAFPGLPYQPAGIPQNLRYHGVSAWRALHDVLGRVQLTTAYDPITNAFSIVDLGVPQPGLIEAVGNYATRLLNDRFPGGSLTTRIPETIRVYFPKQPQHFGTEPDTPREGNWLELGAQFWQDVPTDLNSVAGTVVSLHDDAPALVDFYGDLLNEGELSARAEDRAVQWVGAKTLEVARGSVAIQGIAANLATPGSQVSGVLYRNFGDGWMTELSLTPNRFATVISPATRADASVAGIENTGAGFGGSANSGGSSLADENFIAPDFARRTTPNYPRVMQLVQVTSSEKDANGLYPAVVVRANPAGDFTPDADESAYTDLEPCLIAAANGEGLAEDKVYLSRLNGVAQSDGEWLPLYLTNPATRPVLGRTVADVENDSSSEDNVQVYSVPAGEEPGDEEEQAGSLITAFNKFFGCVPEGAWVMCQDDGDGYYITATIQGDHLVGIVAPTEGLSGSQVALHVPTGGDGTWTEIDVQIDPSDQSTIKPNPQSGDYQLPVVKAALRHWPVLDGEQVTIVWTGSIFTVVASDFQGGIRVQNAGATVAKGGVFADGQLTVYNTSPGTFGAILVETNGAISTPYGDFSAGVKGRVAWNHLGGEAIAAEC